ncbi:MAG: DAK2 domain-containing protein [Clostridia bacterium]|nr:DAK2 domain-containing protein [Clostridia bacterium]
MNEFKYIDAEQFSKAFIMGTENLRAHKQEVNDLNVFPIPDGDTGDNMFMTMVGGVRSAEKSCTSVEMVSKSISESMLLSARGNSGVILSQFFYGMAEGFGGVICADCKQLGYAFRKGAEFAYNAVMQPTEGTILTVIRESVEYACSCKSESVTEYFECLIEEAKRSLSRTPQLLPVLKKAGVVDSGGAGFIYIAEGMRKSFENEVVFKEPELDNNTNEIDINYFTEDSILEFGYCTEILLRLQRSKINPKSFNVKLLTDFLQEIGDSVATFKADSVVKIHVHTMNPGKVLDYCQNFGEFLKVKIENMSLQHNNIPSEEQEKKPYGIVAVASGEGIKKTFINMGADIIVDGGQSMNPSTEDFIRAFKRVDAECIIVFPNNSNVILAAKQAAALYEGNVRVLESHTIGEGYAALSMLDTDLENTEDIISALEEAMQDVVTAEISCCVRDAEMDGVSLKCGNYIGFKGKSILAHGSDRMKVIKETAECMGFDEHYVGIIIRGIDSNDAEAENIHDFLVQKYPFVEFYVVDGGQDVYSYILVAE